MRDSTSMAKQSQKREGVKLKYEYTTVYRITGIEHGSSTDIVTLIRRRRCNPRHCN